MNGRIMEYLRCRVLVRSLEYLTSGKARRSFPRGHGQRAVQLPPYHGTGFEVLSARTNRSIGGRAPSEYLPTLRNNGGYDESRQREILASHHIALDNAATDDFDGFLAAREEALLNLIEQVSGKHISRMPKPESAEALPGEDDTLQDDENSE